MNECLKIVDELRNAGFLRQDIQAITGAQSYMIDQIINGVKLPPLAERKIISNYLGFKKRAGIWNKYLSSKESEKK